MASASTIPDYGAITDVPGVMVGHATNLDALTGCTLILCETPAIGGVDIRGGAASTRGADLLRPMNLVERVDGIMLTGGSAFGLDSICGALEYLEQQGRGFDVGITRVPIVAGAVLFDLNLGDWRVRPDKAMGIAACMAAAATRPAEGKVGAGTGATVGKLLGMGAAMQGGTGTAAIELPGGARVGALVAVNAFGDVYEDGRIIAGVRDIERGAGFFLDTVAMLRHGYNRGGFGRPAERPLPQNTTLAVIATDVQLNREQANRVAMMAHDGFARAIDPVHTIGDGDIAFALSVGSKPGNADTVGIFAAEAVRLAIIRAIKCATAVAGVPAWSDWSESALGGKWRGEKE